MLLTGCEKPEPPKPEDPDAPVIEAVKGQFSVSDSTRVQFAQGNLKYKPSTRTWSFAKHQYDCVGKDNENISDTAYDGWIDLFGWGTGDNPCRVSYSNANDTDGYYSTFHDWGNNISGGWRTLTVSEWNYLLSGRTGATVKYATATVNGMNGLIILPDLFTLPDGCSFTPGVNGWEGNSYTAAQWEKMEAASAVFLPAAGIRWETTVNDVKDYGYYWSSTPENWNSAYILSFNGNSVNASNGTLRHGGMSVRLVRNGN